MVDIALIPGNRIALLDLLEAAARQVRAWRRRARGRAQLTRMGERELRDLGLSRFDARREAGKPFWRP